MQECRNEEAVIPLRIDISFYGFDIDESLLSCSIIFVTHCDGFYDWFTCLVLSLSAACYSLLGRSRVADEEEFEDGEEGGLDYLMQR